MNKQLIKVITNENNDLELSSLVAVHNMRNALNEKFVDRSAEIDAILIGIVASQHVLLIGQAGTAKSALVTEIFKNIVGEESKYFQWLLSSFTKEDELFGSVKLSSLESGLYERNTFGKLPQADYAFLDEIFKANSAILNSLLTAINERLYYNGSNIEQIPLKTVVGASNEYPQEDGLTALFDRFLLRREVNYIENDNDFYTMLKGSDVEVPSVDCAEIEELHMAIDFVVIPDDVLTVLTRLRTEIKNSLGFLPSDRRFKKSLKLLQAVALLNGRMEVEIFDLNVLKDVLWEEVEQKEGLRLIIENFTIDTVINQFNQFHPILMELSESADTITDKSTASINKLSEISTKVEYISKEIKSIRINAENNNDWDDEKSVVYSNLFTWVEKITETLSDKILM